MTMYSSDSFDSHLFALDCDVVKRNLLLVAALACIAVPSMASAATGRVLTPGSLVFQKDDYLLNTATDRRLRVKKGVSEEERCRRGIIRCKKKFVPVPLNARKVKPPRPKVDAPPSPTPPDGHQMAQRDTQRRYDINILLNAVYMWSIDNPGKAIAGVTGTAKEICFQSPCTDLIDLNFLRGTYLVSIPRDPLLTTSGNGSRYRISKDSKGRVTVDAPDAEGGKAMTVAR